MIFYTAMLIWMLVNGVYNKENSPVSRAQQQSRIATIQLTDIYGLYDNYMVYMDNDGRYRDFLSGLRAVIDQYNEIGLFQQTLIGEQSLSDNQLLCLDTKLQLAEQYAAYIMMELPNCLLANDNLETLIRLLSLSHATDMSVVDDFIGSISLEEVVPNEIYGRCQTRISTRTSEFLKLKTDMYNCVKS
jgi:hypothetical protein